MKGVVVGEEVDPTTLRKNHPKLVWVVHFKFNSIQFSLIFILFLSFQTARSARNKGGGGGGRWNKSSNSSSNNQQSSQSKSNEPIVMSGGLLICLLTFLSKNICYSSIPLFLSFFNLIYSSIQISKNLFF